jgi:hypothetical protein
MNAWSPQAQLSPNDPYRGGAEAAAFRGLSSTPRIIYLCLVIVSCLGFFGTAALFAAAGISADHGQPDDTLITIAMLVFVLTIFVLYAQIFLGIYWLYKVWDWLPFDQRYTRHWRSWITPAQASLFLLIPYFHYYWMFMINCGLCDAIDRMRVTYPTRDNAPKGLAIAAGVCQLVIPLPVGAIMWLVFMSKIERLTREMSSANVPRMLPLGAPGAM